jgi:hypothetical protein
MKDRLVFLDVFIDPDGTRLPHARGAERVHEGHVA